MPSLVHGQPSRFATILLYLNDDMEGGETEFPRWLNAETSEGLKIKPEVGKAVLFYNLLPDGNYDERSVRTEWGRCIQVYVSYWRCCVFWNALVRIYLMKFR
jgi:hypothetical protein